MRNDIYSVSNDDHRRNLFLRCRSELAEMSIIRVFVTGRFSTKITTSARVTFTGQLANLGGPSSQYMTL